MAWWKRSPSKGHDDAAPADPNMPLIRLEGITGTGRVDRRVPPRPGDSLPRCSLAKAAHGRP